MRLSFALAALAFAAPSSAQYFSEGWAPGKPVPTAAAPAPEFDPNLYNIPPPAAPKPGQSLFSLDTLLTSAPVTSLLERFNINITERLAAAHEALELWDHRIPLITDDNYEDIIVNEELTEEEEKDRTWFLIVSVTTAQTSGVSAWADKQFDEAFNMTQIAGDLPNVRWGRIDYINVTMITTRWVVWQAPMLIVLKDRGQTLRFWRANQIRLKPESLREFLRTENWQHTPPWSTSFSPGGKREFVMVYFAQAMTKMYDIMRWIPRWAIYIVTGALGSVLINLFHRGEKEKVGKGAKVVEGAPAAPAAASGSSTAVAKPQQATATAKGRGKKGKK